MNNADSRLDLNFFIIINAAAHADAYNNVSSIYIHIIRFTLNLLLVHINAKNIHS
jgi:hypothetical protein